MANTEPLTLRPDAKGRITLGRLAEGISGFRVSQTPDGSLHLLPLKEIPAREVWLYRNPQALAAVEEGMRQSGRGETVRMSSFAKYANDED